jgi:hypothetical protein
MLRHLCRLVLGSNTVEVRDMQSSRSGWIRSLNDEECEPLRCKIAVVNICQTYDLGIFFLTNVLHVRQML